MKSVAFVLLLLLVLRVVIYKSPWINAQDVRITTYVSSEPSRTDTKQGIRLPGLYISLPLYPEIHYGDTIVVEGTVEDKFLKDAKLISIKESSQKFLSLRERLLTFMLKGLPSPESGLVSGMVLGSKSTLPDSYKQALRKTGTSHVVVASGMNVTLMASFIMSIFLKFLSRKKAIWAGIGGIILYILLVGVEAPVVRAGIMATILLVGQGAGRLYSSLWSLFLTSWLMIFINPSWIVDIGFLLSVVATLSLILFEPRIRKRIQYIPSLVRESISTSLAAQIGVAPIIWASFGNFNILSPLINALVLWVVPIVTVGGIVGSITSLISVSLGNIILLLIYPFLLWFSTVIRIFA